MCSKPLFIERDPGIRQRMPDLFYEIIELRAVRDPGPVQVAKTAGPVQRDPERLKRHGLQRLQDLVRVIVFADKGKR